MSWKSEDVKFCMRTLLATNKTNMTPHECLKACWELVWWVYEAVMEKLMTEVLEENKSEERKSFSVK